MPCVSIYRTSATALKRDYGNDDERLEAMKAYYDSTPQVEVPLREAIPEIINGVTPFSTWEALLKKLKINVPYQPATVDLSDPQSKGLRTVRDEQLAYTVAGQKALFRAIVEAFYGQKRRNLRTLRLVVSRANKVFEKNLFTREPHENNPFLNVLFDNKNRMTWAEGPVELSRRILGHALGSSSDAASLLEDYQKWTERDPAVVEKYWKKVEATWPKT